MNTMVWRIPPQQHQGLRFFNKWSNVSSHPRRFIQGSRIQPSTSISSARQARIAVNEGAASASKLDPPTIIYQDHHLLVVNKPPGWHSVPNNYHQSVSATNNSNRSNNNNSKCLLSELKRQKLGGGLDQQLLLPLHRIDQPCSGILLLAKTKRVASRITQVWKEPREAYHRKDQIDEKEDELHYDEHCGMRKTYLCVVWANDIPKLMEESILENSSATNNKSSDDWYQLQGLWHRNVKQKPRLSKPQRQQQGEGESFQGWSVVMTKVRDGLMSDRVDATTTRLCQLSWRVIPTTPLQEIQSHGNDEKRIPTTATSTTQRDATATSTTTLLQIQTRQGARHMVRAMLAQIGHCPIVGDVRYGPDATKPFTPHHPWDHSVALHARSLEWFQASVKRQGPPKQQRFYYAAPIPILWNKYFGIDNAHLTLWNV